MGNIEACEVPQLSALLESEGGLDFTQQETFRLTHLALDNFYLAEPQQPAKDQITEIASKFLKRTK